MKILHTSDLHLGSPLNAHLSPDKVRERKAELLSSFERMAEDAVHERVRVFIIAGDLFDTEKITRALAERVLGIMARYPSLDFLYLSGNHEKTALADSGAAIPNNLKFFGDEWTYFNYEYEQVCIAGRSEISEGMFSSLNLNYDKSNIVVLHGALAQARSGGETIGMREAEGKSIDYMALGHYHSYSRTVLDDGCTAVYCGTPEGRGFDEAGAKGYVIIEADGKNVRHSFRQFAKRTLHIVNVGIENAESPIAVEDRISDAIRAIPHSDIVRIVLSGERLPELFIDPESLSARWRQSYYHFELRDESMIRIDPESYRYDRSLKGEFIRLVMSKEDMTDGEKDRIIRMGLAALVGSLDEI